MYVVAVWQMKDVPLGAKGKKKGEKTESRRELMT